MNSVAALEAALVNAPDDPLVYAAYADALADADDPRGGFHHLLMRLDSMAVGPELIRTERELHRLWDPHKRDWLLPTRRRFAKVGFYRLDGAVPLVNTAHPTAALADELAASPVWWLLRGLRVEGEPDVPGFLGRFVRSRVRTLQVVGAGSGDAVIELLVSTGWLDRLTELHLPGCRVTDDGALALAAHPRTPHLRPLDLDSNRLSHVGVAALAEVGVTVSPQQYL